MKKDKTISYRSKTNEDSIDTITLLKKIWNDRMIVLKAVILSFIIGCFIAILSPVVYISETTFVPQTSDTNDSNKSLNSLASLAGINLSQESSALDTYVSPLLYSKIIESEEFLISLINKKLILVDGKEKSIKDYISESNFFNFNIIGFIKKYTFDQFKSGSNEVTKSKVFKDFNFISKEEYGAINAFKEKFKIEINAQDGYIKVLAEDKDAFVSSQLAKLVTKELQSRIISLRTNKIKEQLEYSKDEYFKKKEEFERLQNNLAEFKDSNKNISSAVFLAELEKLESEYRLQENIMISLATEYNNNKIKFNKDTPIFSVIDDVSVPNQKSKPKRKQILFISIILGFIISTSYSLSVDRIKEVIQKVTEN